MSPCVQCGCPKWHPRHMLMMVCRRLGSCLLHFARRLDRPRRLPTWRLEGTNETIKPPRILFREPLIDYSERLQRRSSTRSACVLEAALQRHDSRNDKDR